MAVTARIVWVLPSVDPEFRRACLAGLAPDVHERTLVLDNARPSHNRGVAASWNLGVDRARNERADWLVICSESMRFGTAGGTDFEAQLAGPITWGACDQTCHLVVHTGEGFCRNGYGWHLVAIATETLDRVGRFDEHFYPAWWEDSDWIRRAGLAGIGPGRTANDVDAHLAACEHSTATGLVTGTWADTLPVYEKKWGAPPPGETFRHPYGDPTLDLTYTGDPP